MHAFLKFLVVVTILVVLVGVLFKISQNHLDNSAEPKRIAPYQEAVGSGFSALGTTRVLDPRDAGPLIEPSASLTEMTNYIVHEACPKEQYSCITAALHRWVRGNIEYVHVLPTREHIISPEETILYRQGDDLTLAILLGAMLRSQGIEARIGHTAYSTFVELNPNTRPLRIDPGCSNCNIGSIRYSGEEAAITWIA